MSYHHVQRTHAISTAKFPRMATGCHYNYVSCNRG